MLSSLTEAEIEKKIEPFTDPEFTMAHGRGITAEQADQCGLNVEQILPNSELW